MRSVKSHQRLSTKFLSIGLGLLLLALLSIGLTVGITRQLDGGAAAVNEAGRLRMQAWRLMSFSATGRTDAEIGALVSEFDATMRLLHDGDARRPLFVPWNEATLARYADLEMAWSGLRPAWTPGPGRDVTALPVRVEAFVGRVDDLVREIEGTLARLTAILNLFQLTMMVLAVAAAVLMLYVGYLFVIQPLQRNRRGLQQIEAGDFSARVDVDSKDEFGELAAGFNHMAATLQELYGGLERKVAEKTRDLESKRDRLAALYEMSNFLVNVRQLDELAQGFASKIRRLSHADAVAVRWSDPDTQRYLMLASDALAPELALQESCLEPGACACGQIQTSARTRVIPIVSDPHHMLGHCARAGYAAVVGIPVRLQQRVLGEVDLFYRQDLTLSTEDRDLYEALAGHLANAIENLRSEALLREAAVGEERNLLARELHDSIAQSLSFLKIQVSLLRTAMDRADPVQAAQVVDEIDTGVRECTNDVRELLVHFRTRADGENIEQAVRATLRKFEHQSGVRSSLEMHGHGVALDSDVQLQVLHVVQEALSNVRKHARASQVQMDVYRGPHWVFRVRDDGCGFDPSATATDETHVGMQIMRERAARIGAHVEVRSRPGDGTEVRLELAAASQHIPGTPT